MQEVAGIRCASVASGLCASLLVAAGFLSSSASAQPAGNIAGTVADTSGLALFGVEIRVDSSPVRAYTDEQGAFHLGGLTLGSHLLTARRLGFLPSRLNVDVSQMNEATVALRLIPVATSLPPVVIKPAKMNYTGRLAGYYERLEKKSNGYFITRDQIDRENPRMLGQLLQHVPGINAVRGRGGITGVRMRGRNCWPLVWIDGTPMPSGEVDLDSFSPSTIQGVELYLGSTTAPTRYTYTRDASSCGTILLWSRGPDTDPIRSDRTPSVDLAALVANLSVFNAGQVDRRARLDTTKTLPLQFPAALFAAGIHGLVIAEFIVDTAGRIENGTVGIVSSTAPLFTEAVRAALDSAAYLPAIKDGRLVRQLVQQPFEFSVDRQARAR